MPWLYLVDNPTPQRRTPENGMTWELQELYRLLECDIVQFVYLEANMIMVIDEEGKLRTPPKPINHVATRLAIQQQAIASDDYIVGPALITSRKSLGTE